MQSVSFWGKKRELGRELPGPGPGRSCPPGPRLVCKRQKNAGPQSPVLTDAAVLSWSEGPKDGHLTPS